MGDYVLMKKTLLILTLSCVTSLYLFGDELSWVDEQINAIKPPRKGLSSAQIKSVESPFLYLKRKKSDDDKSSKDITTATAVSSDLNVTKKPHVMHLTTVINQHVQINGKWYTKGDKVHGYTIAKVMPTIVLLEKNKKKIVLTTKTKSTTLKFK